MISLATLSLTALLISGGAQAQAPAPINYLTEAQVPERGPETVSPEEMQKIIAAKQRQTQELVKAFVSGLKTVKNSDLSPEAKNSVYGKVMSIAGEQNLEPSLVNAKLVFEEASTEIKEAMLQTLKEEYKKALEQATQS